MVDLVLNLFDQYISDQNSRYDFDIKKIWSKSSYLDNTPFKSELKINSDIQTIKNLYQKYKIIQLRKLTTETKLIIGCGNGPVFWGSLPILLKFQKILYGRVINKTGDKYNSDHSHINCYTINPDIGMNPSVVGEFGISDFKFLPKNYFEEIIFEGFMLDPESNKNTIQTILYLLKPNGSVGQFKKINNKLCHPTGLEISDDLINSYKIFFDNYGEI